jgi:hypothetical protein
MEADQADQADHTAAAQEALEDPEDLTTKSSQRLFTTNDLGFPLC